jgi:hypothetical protein
MIMKPFTKRKKIMITVALIILIPLVILGILGSQKIHTERELIIDKNVNEVWDVMGLQFAQVHLWSSYFLDSKAGGIKQFEALAYSERITQTDRGETVQVLDSFDSENYQLAYHITKGMPGIAKAASGVWSLEATENNKTMVTIAFDMEIKNAIGYLLSPVIKLKIGKSAEEIAEELKYYVENGEAHARKLAQQNK